MVLFQLSPTIVLNGIFSILVVVVFLIVGVSIITKYRKHRDITYILTGLSWIGISEPWWPSSLGFIVALYNDVGLNAQTYLILNHMFLPIFLTFWLIVVTKLINFQRRGVVLVIHLIISVILVITEVFFYITDISMIGVVLSPVDVDFGIVAIIFNLYILIVFVITGLIFAYKTYKIGDPQTKLRGVFLLLAILLFLIGAILEIIITLPQNRIILFVSAICFYIGFIMPERVKKIFIKEQ